jgi:hypothetical protein
MIKSSSVHIIDLQIPIMSITKRATSPNLQPERKGEKLENVFNATNHGKPNESFDSISNHNAKGKYLVHDPT